MSENNNVRLGLIELYKNKVRFLNFTDVEINAKHESKFLSDEEYEILINFYNEYKSENK